MSSQSDSAETKTVHERGVWGGVRWTQIGRRTQCKLTLDGKAAPVTGGQPSQRLCRDSNRVRISRVLQYVLTRGDVVHRLAERRQLGLRRRGDNWGGTATEQRVQPGLHATQLLLIHPRV